MTVIADTVEAARAYLQRAGSDTWRHAGPNAVLNAYRAHLPEDETETE